MAKFISLFLASVLLATLTGFISDLWVDADSRKDFLGDGRLNAPLSWYTVHLMKYVPVGLVGGWLHSHLKEKKKKQRVGTRDDEQE